MSIEHNLNSYMNHLAGEKNSSQYTLRNYRREIGEFGSRGLKQFGCGFHNTDFR